jgi:hypothetical protein
LTRRLEHIVRALFVIAAVAVAGPSFGQNTKGDRPVDNSRTVRETKGKSVKKRSKATTRDIAGRRLRTKNKSSANRANVGIPQPSTTARHPRRVTDRAAPAPANKRWASREQRRSDPDRSWQGDISGSKPRRIRPKGTEETGRNVYPQGEYATRQPTRPPAAKYRPTKTVSGRPIVKRTPQHSERAWKGDIKGQPFSSPRSVSGQIKNVYRQKNKYSRYVNKQPSGKDVAFNNKAKIARAARMGTDTSPKNWKRSITNATGSAPFITRGRKNVYWGKVKIRERARTKDLAGRPLYKRNFQSSGIGLTGRDTLAFFGRKPHGDVMGKGRGRKYLPGSEAKGGWLNDIAGYRLRNRTSQGRRTGGFSGFRSVSGLFRNNKPIQGKAPGIGAGAIERNLNRTGGVSGKNFGDQGGSYTGFLKAKRQQKFRGGARSALWNNNRSPIAGKALPSSAGAAGRYSGNLRGSAKAFNDQGGSYTGYLKARKPHKFSGSMSGGMWNNNRTPVEGKLLPGTAGRAGRYSGNLRGSGKSFNDQGGSYTGYLKAKKPHKFSGSMSGGMWNNNRTPVEGKLLPGTAGRAGRYSGNLRGSGKSFNDQGGSYTGYLKAKKPHKFSGSMSGGMWNNNRTPVEGKVLPGNAGRAGNFTGNIKSSGKAFNDQGGSYTGYLKPKKKGKMVLTPNVLWNNNNKSVTELEAGPNVAAAGNFQGRKKIRSSQKGKMLLTPSVLWNNNETPVTRLETTRLAAKAGYFKGNNKTRQPEKGKIMTSPNVLWNNNEKATTQVGATKAGSAAGLYQGRSKAKKPEKYPLNTSRMAYWNNEGKATTQINLTASGQRAGEFSGKTKYRKESKNRDTEIEDRMKVKKQYTQNPHAVEEAIKKEKPNVNYKAGNFASGAKMAGRRTHHPNSASDAVDGVSHASARRIDYQGNVKMRKFFDRHGESPDAKFINPGENNVKEDRTIITNVKLLWARLFQKSESQPANLKDKSNKLRYDKREKGMWAD